MITIKEPFVPEQFYPGICPTDSSMLFFDIETTGFSREFHQIYLIGAAACHNGIWSLHQWFAQTPEEEKDVIQAFLDFSIPFDTLIHFNGTRFDLPFTEARARLHQIEWTLDFAHTIDLMTIIKPYKSLCHLENCRQKSVEQMLGLSGREDVMTGGELIPIYYSYLRSPDSKKLDLLLLHNADDVRGMTALTQAASIPDFFKSRFCFTSCSESKQGLILHYQSDVRLRSLCQAVFDFWEIQAGGDTLSLSIPILNKELKHFYKDYQNYYYLPEEDIIVHKSIAEFVDKKHKKKATRQNCCVKKNGQFLPQPDLLITPEFREKPVSKFTYLPLETFPQTKDFAEQYLKALFVRYQLF